MVDVPKKYITSLNRSFTNISYDEKRGMYGQINKPLYKLDMNTVTSEAVTLDSESDQTILTDVAITDGSVAAGDYTLALGTLTESRNLVLTITDGDVSISAGTVTVTGTDDDDAVITDSLDLSVGLTKTTANVYKTITNIAVASLAGEGVGDKIKLVTAEIGLTGVFSVANNAAILTSDGAMVGHYVSATYNNTSFAVATGTAIDQEVLLNDWSDEDTILAALGLGEYAIDYTNGLIYYKKKTSTTAITVNYKYWDQAVTLEVGSITIGAVDINSPTGMVDGAKVVTTAGTAEALGASTAIKSVTIKASSANTGIIYVGGSGVSSATGISLGANDSVDITIANLATVYIDSSVSGEGVGFVYFT